MITVLSTNLIIQDFLNFKLPLIWRPATSPSALSSGPNGSVESEEIEGMGIALTPTLSHQRLCHN